MKTFSCPQCVYEHYRSDYYRTSIERNEEYEQVISKFTSIRNTYWTLIGNTCYNSWSKAIGNFDLCEEHKIEPEPDRYTPSSEAITKSYWRVFGINELSCKIHYSWLCHE